MYITGGSGSPTAATKVPTAVRRNPKFYPFFKTCVGAIDGTHISVEVSTGDRARYRDRNGNLTINVLAACTFDLMFCYVLSGWEGSANDATTFDGAVTMENMMDRLIIPPGLYCLADAGFGSDPGLELPFNNVRYHLKEWARAFEQSGPR